MSSELIIYNYQTSRVKQELILQYIRELLENLHSNKIDVDFLQIVDGNKLYPSTFNLIGKILKYWSNDYHDLSTVCIYYSFFGLYSYLKQRNIKNFDFINQICNPSSKKQQKQIRDDLINLVESDTKPNFFNSIIITGNLYKLEAPHGVAIGDILEGGICLNSNMHRNSIWHETAHLLGANDHYDKSNHYQSIHCDDSNNCLMQWDSLKGNRFCKNSLTEIYNHLEKFKKFGI